MKKLFELIGLVAIAAALYFWSGGMPSLKTLAAQCQHATAAKTAKIKLSLARKEADSLKDEIRKANEDRGYENILFDRRKAELEKALLCMKNLASVLKKAGVQKVSDFETLSEKIRQKKIVFLGEKLSVAEGIEQLLKLQKDYDAENRILERKAALIERLGDYVSQLSKIREDLLASIEKLEIKLEELKIEDRLASLEATTSELAASGEGRYLGKIGKDLETLQSNIDRAKARTVVAQEEIAKAKISKHEESSCNLCLDDLF